MRKLSKEDFIQKVHEIHGDKYDYSKVDYINYSTKVCIICPKHGEFWMTPSNHINGKQGCPKCKFEKQSKEPHRKSKTTEQFIEDAKKIHVDKYDYSKFIYINNKTKGIIICPKHGEFLQEPSNHLKGMGCPECGRKIRKRKTTEQFILEAIQKHGNKYSYDKTIYVRKQDKVLIHCNICGTDFWQEASAHLKGQGCPECNKNNSISKGEQLVMNILNELKIPFDYQVKEYDCIHNRNFIYDFVINLNNKKYIIEYNGRQHYIPIEYLGGKLRFSEQTLRDENLRDYCKIKKYNLLEIKYDIKDNQIKTLIKDFIYGNNF